MIGVEAPSVENEMEALMLMIHHLTLAAAYFEATPDPLPAGWANAVGHSRQAASMWAIHMDDLYPKG